MCLILLIYHLDDQLLPDMGCVGLAAFAANHFGADDLRPLVDRLLAALTALEDDLLRRPLVVPTERHLLNVVVLRDALDDSHQRLLSQGTLRPPGASCLQTHPTLTHGTTQCSMSKSK